MEGILSDDIGLPAVGSIERARREIRPWIDETPLVRSELLSRALEAEVWIKNETVGPIASFKLRGALTHLLRASGLKGAVTSSTGNHGQGVAYGARLLGVPSHIFLPLVNNPVKRAMIKAFGATLHEVGEDIDAAKAAARTFAAQHGLEFVDDGESLDMMDGAGTVGLECAERLDGIDWVFVPMGAATLFTGVATAVKALQPGCRAVAVQAKGAPAMVDSFHAGRAVEAPIDTVADGLACRIPATRALAGLIALADDAMTVSDGTMLQAVRSIAECAHVLVEPAGAAALAGAWERRAEVRGQRVVLLFSGANIPHDVLMEALEGAPLFTLEEAAARGAG
ncbi:MAG: pyridoxal-phosphate dependent enzyme [Alphaproteobacteria bacterium]|nr:pyridoxal-phosphate dependent enzyme [Alphaproteobacteria bacterium]